MFECVVIPIEVRLEGWMKSADVSSKRKDTDRGSTH